MAWKLEYAAKFVAEWEGLLLHAYQDSGGIWTIGYGHTGPEVGPGDTTTSKKALRQLTSDLREASRAVERNVHVPLTTRERIACISFVFNIGEGGLQESSFLKYLNQGKKRKASNRLLLWVKDDHGTTLLGLLRRRRAERWLFRHPRQKQHK